MESSKTCIPIEEGQLGRWTEAANRLLMSVAWTPKPLQAAAPAGNGVSTPRFRESTVMTTPAEEKVSLVGIARAVSRDPVLLSEETNHVLTEVRQGLRLGMHLSSLYTAASGLQSLVDQNARGGLSEQQKTEFRAKYETASAVAVFVTADYVRWALASYKAEEVSSARAEPGGLPELHLLNPVRALDCLVFYYGANLQTPGAVNTGAEFVRMTLLYFEKVVEEVKLREGALGYTEPFTSRDYKLVGSEYSVSGFEPSGRPREVSVEFNRVELHQIVGNRDAKHKARRLAERLLCYDPRVKRNPMYDLGGLQLVRMGHGEPGTGKSLQIAATATMLSDYCQMLGIPFLFWPMPDTVVSTYQGGSAERMVAWMKPLSDPTKIIYAPVDDAENNLEDRTRQGVSAGVREVIGVFLRYTEGAYAVHHGNAAVELYTNLPDQLDKAVLSRIMDRYYIGGAQTPEDFFDQDYLWWRKYEEVLPGFVDMRMPEDYEPMSAQRLAASLSQVYEGVAEPEDERLQAIFRRVAERYDVKDHRFFSEFFTRVKEAFPLFTSRDVRNIQQAVSVRVLDFDLEPEWLENPDVFFRKDYDTKKAMLTELMKANMKGLSFAEIRLQETVRYLDSMVRIVSAGRERRLQELMTQMELQMEAQQKLARAVRQEAR